MPAERCETLATLLPGRASSVCWVHLERQPVRPAKNISKVDAARVADKLLAKNHCAESARLGVREAFTALEDDIDFDHFLATAGRVYQDTMLVSHTGLDHSEDDLPLDGVIHSSYDERTETPAEILPCGAEAMTAMLTEIKAARSEIMMSWWEFCLASGIRGDRGIDA